MEPTNPVSHEELIELNEKFREVKHSINNSLAVIMALSELAQRNPANFEKLAAAVLARSPDIVTQLQSFQKFLSHKLGIDEPEEK
jgi:two-component sensor histidine kinase